MPLIDPFSSLTAALSIAHLSPTSFPRPSHPQPSSPSSFPPALSPPVRRVPISETVDAPKVAIAAAPREEDIGEDGLVKNFGADGPKYTLAMFDPRCAECGAADEPAVSALGGLQITGLTPDPDPTLPAVQAKLYARCGTDAVSPSGPTEGQRAASPPSFTIPEDAPEHDATPAGRRHWDAVKFGERNGLELAGVGWYLVRSEQ
ncbi:hypothetical protein B0H14DRAFT_3878454 [Mycena olivaceomarginata]|nr:hypothetical protein B0H14DRAFT_3878454 [Mycena olivaceomarginata]